MLAQPQQATQLEPELGTAQAQLVFVFVDHLIIFLIAKHM